MKLGEYQLLIPFWNIKYLIEYSIKRKQEIKEQKTREQDFIKRENSFNLLANNFIVLRDEAKNLGYYNTSKLYDRQIGTVIASYLRSEEPIIKVKTKEHILN